MQESQRKRIRHYIKEMLKATFPEMSKNIFSNRPRTINPNELPGILVHYGTDLAMTTAGDERRVTEMTRKLPIMIDIMMEAPVYGEDSQYQDEYERLEDTLDDTVQSAKRALIADLLLARKLPGFDPNSNYKGLSEGTKFVSEDPYDVVAEAVHMVAAVRLTIEIAYLESFAADKKFLPFNSFSADIKHVENGAATDQTLITLDTKVDNA